MKILIFSSSRADYGILENLINEINKKKKIELYLGVTGTHFSKKYGKSIQYINKNIKLINFNTANLIKDNSITIIENVSSLFKKTLKILNQKNFDALIVLGDRYELLGITIPFFFYNIPIIHLHGGEKTLGSYDDTVRDLISIMSSLNFASTDQYKKNLEKLLNKKKNIYSVGSLAVEKIHNTKNFYSKKVLEKNLKIKIGEKNVLVLLHPETRNVKYFDKKLKIFFKFLQNIYNRENYIFFSSPGHDIGGNKIFEQIKQFTKRNSNTFFLKSIGNKYFFSFVRNCDVVIGNSSSGIIEIPSIKVPVINVGIRQRGRLQSKNIINSNFTINELEKSFNKATNKKYKELIAKSKNIYFKKNTKKIIIKKIINFLNDKKI